MGNLANKVWSAESAIARSKLQGREDKVILSGLKTDVQVTPEEAQFLTDLLYKEVEIAEESLKYHGRTYGDRQWMTEFINHCKSVLNKLGAPDCDTYISMMEDMYAKHTAKCQDEAPLQQCICRKD